MGSKGLCVDDATLRECPGSLPSAWPNLGAQAVRSVRLLRPWHSSWGGVGERRRAWAALTSWVSTLGAKVFLGTQVTCDTLADDEMWRWNLDLMALLGKERIMGMAIGQEMDIFRDSRSSVDSACNVELWKGRYWAVLQNRVSDMDSKGFTEVKVTAVWGLSVLGSIETPFKEDSAARVNSLLSRAHARWGGRWVWTFNAYSVWDRSLWPDSKRDCAEKARAAVSIQPVKSILRDIRRRIKQITGKDDDPLWVGENGWPSLAPGSVKKELPFCPEFWSMKALKRAYRNFLSWDMSIGDGLHGPDHAFYFAVRDSTQSSTPESFGLLHSCTNTSCKIQKALSALLSTFVM